MAEQMRNESSERVRIPRMRRAARGVLAAAGVAVVSGLALFSSANIRGNWNDTKDLQKFTSPSEQQARCDIQAAFDAQDRMYEHFSQQGGVTEDEANMMGPIVGLEPSEVKDLLNTQLYRMDYDCGSPEASSSEATKGMLAAAVAGGMIVGAAGAGVFVALRPEGRE